MTRLFLSFLEISLSVSLMVLLMHLLSPFFTKRYGAQWSYWIWIFLALRLLIPFRGEEGVFIVHGLWRARTSNSIEAQEGYQVPFMKEEAGGGMIFKIPAQMTAPIQVRSKKGSISITPLDISAAVWMLGSLTFISIHLFSYFHYKSQVRKRGRILKNSSVLHQISKLKHKLHIKSQVQVVIYTKAFSPMMTGILKPVLILPEAFYFTKELSFILKHELVHLKRRDVAVKLLFIMATGIHWFNPLIWMMQKEAVMDMELSCDERVIKGADYSQRKAYVEALLSVFRRGSIQKTSFSIEFYGGKKSMKKRFKNILVEREKKNGVVIFLCAILSTAVLGAMVGCSTAKGSKEEVQEQIKKEEAFAERQEEAENQEPDSHPAVEIQPTIDAPQNGQIYGYVTECGVDSLTIDYQLWVTPESQDWKSEYDEDAGFEVVDVPGEDVTYFFYPECTYSALENHQGPASELTKEEFEVYLRELEYPVLWVIELKNGQVKSIQEQYRP